jgi:MtaA/CmuA family methyltransferase
MHNGIKAVALLKERIGKEKIVEGWIEGPIAEAADLRGINTLMMDFYDDPAFVRELFAFVVEMELRFAKEQVAAGADLIGIGDAAASLIGPQIYHEFVWPYEKTLVEGVHRLGAKVRLHICGNTRPHLENMGRLGCEIVDLDYLAPISDGRQKMGPNQILLGNVNPVQVLRNGTVEGVRKAIADCHQQAGARFIVGAGCEVPRDTAAENLRALCDYAHAHRP